MEAVTAFLLPHAGGMSYTYNAYKNAARGGLAFEVAEYAGRGSRAGEAPRASIEAMAEDLFALLRSGFCAPGGYALFGHSMGALVAYELCKRVGREPGMPAPRLLAVSACAAPGEPDGVGINTDASDEAFAQDLVRLGFTSREVFASAELRELFLPVLRADCRGVARYRAASAAGAVAEPVACRVLALGGEADGIPVQSLRAWEKIAPSGDRFRLETMPGGHFYLFDHVDRVVAAIASECIDLQ